MSRTKIVQLMLPWFGNHDGELYYTAMSLSFPDKVDRRKAFRIIRKWYKTEIGVTMDKQALVSLWKRRHETFAIDEGTVNSYLQDMARRTHEETEEDTDSGVQETTTN